MTFRNAVAAGAAALMVAASATAAMSQASDAAKTAPTRSEPGSSEGMLPSDRSTPQNAPGVSDGRTASGSKSNAEAQKMDAEKDAKTPAAPSK